MEDWSARQYLKFEDERTRPPRDLLAQVPLQRPRLVVDLGCGPGNSTELLVERFPQSEVIGLDSSPDMLRKARERLPVAHSSRPISRPGRRTRAPIFCSPMQPSNGCRIIRRCCTGLLEALPAGGVLAVQMPDNTHEPSNVLQREVAGTRPVGGHRSISGRRSARRPAAARGLLRSAQAGLLAHRHLAQHLQSRDGDAAGHRRMVQGLFAAAVSVAARRCRRANNFSPPTRKKSPPPTSRASTARCC